MKKTLPTESIINELSGSSAFFQKPVQQSKDPQSPTPRKAAPTKHKIIPEKKQSVAKGKPPITKKNRNISPVDNEGKGKNDIEHKYDSGLASYHASTIERIRKVVKDNGREVAFTRLSPEEKQQIKDLIYTYGRQGIKTSENEIVRIALNYILEDYQESGKESVLERVIEALNA